MIIDKSWYQRPPHVPAGNTAGGVVVRREGRRVFVALAKEQEFEEYVLPKGHVDEGENVEQAARREIEEEVGIADLHLLEFLGVRERLSLDRNEWKRTHYFLFITEQVDAKPTETDKHEEMGWFPLDNLPALFWPEQKALLEENRDRILGLVATHA